MFNPLAMQMVNGNLGANGKMYWQRKGKMYWMLGCKK
jgi:hypothetical protein